MAMRSSSTAPRARSAMACMSCDWATACWSSALLKRGQGGIRDIEFLVQCLQLLRGGREPELRTVSLMAALDALERRDLLPAELVASLRDAVTNHFERQMPGFLCDEGVLHGVETRTSSPVRVSRDRESLQAIGTKALFPAGEGAGFAGGIVSAAVDGMAVANAILNTLDDEHGTATAANRGKFKGVGSFY